MAEPLNYSRTFIGSKLIEPAGSRLCEVKSPHDGQTIGTIPFATRQDVDHAVEVARAAFDAGHWPGAKPDQRISIVERFCDLYRQRSEDMARLVTSENGIPIRFNQLLAADIPAYARAYAEGARRLEWRRRTATPAGNETIINRQAAGVVAAFVPWNAPQVFALGWLTPALLSGCAVILVLPPEAPLNGRRLGDLLCEAGLWEGVVSILVADAETGAYIAAHPDIDMIAYAGSTSVGAQMASTAAATVKRLTLSLGGKSAAIIMPDADLEPTVDGLRHASFFANGEWPTNQTRLLVPRRRQVEFVDAVVAMAKGLRIGDPHDQATFIGPLISRQRCDLFRRFVDMGIAGGARLALGGAMSFMDGPVGNYVQPTVFADVANEMPIAQRDIFGPLVTIIPYADLDHAVRIANDSSYGASASIWTSDEGLGTTIAGKIRAGTVSINGACHEPGAPVGGFRQSGLGRIFGISGIEEFVELQTISV